LTGLEGGELARELGDVLHYFIPEDDVSPPPERLRQPDPTPLAVVAVPAGERDVVRTAFVWNLAVEIARLGAAATVVAPGDEASESLWPQPGRGPMGTEFVPSFARDLPDLAKAASELASSRGLESRSGGMVLVQVPPRWLDQAGSAERLLRRTLLFSSAEPRELAATRRLSRRLLPLMPEGQVGVTIHGVRSIDEAREAFDTLASALEPELQPRLVSYGLLLDDLDVYRAIVNRRPIGVIRPQSRAARALADVARLLLDDAGLLPSTVAAREPSTERHCND
jgi:hypothetical protein